MRFMLALFALSLPLSLLAADDEKKPEAKPNTLTAKEIADGWISLFDGETTFGWKIEGKSQIDQGALILGGEESTSATTTSSFGDFDMEAVFTGTGLDMAKVVLNGIEHPCFENTPSQLFKRKGTCAVRSKDGTHTVQFRCDDAQRLPGAGVRASGTFGEKAHPGASNTYVSFRLPAGSKLVLFAVRLKPHDAKPLFNGKDLTGWKAVEGKPSEFAVNAEGELTIKNGPGDLHTEGQWDDFLLQLDVKSNGTHLNSGVFFRSVPNEFWSGYEAQIRNEWVTELTLKDGTKLQGSVKEKGDQLEVQVCEVKEGRVQFRLEKKEVDGKERSVRMVKSLAKSDIESRKELREHPIDFGTGGLYNRQPSRKVPSTDGEWCTMTVLAHGPHIAIWVNGHQTVDFTEKAKLGDNARKGGKITAGTISLQGHDPTTDLSFRNLRIAALPKAQEKGP